MRQLAAVLILCGVCFAQGGMGPGPGTPHSVSSGPFTITTVSSGNCEFRDTAVTTVACTAGAAGVSGTDIAVVSINWQAGTPYSSITDDAGAISSFTCSAQSSNGTNSAAKWCWGAVTSNGTPNIKVTWGSSLASYGNVLVKLFRCSAACTWSLDQGPSNAQPTAVAGTITGTTLTSSHSDSVLYLSSLSGDGSIANGLEVKASGWDGVGPESGYRCQYQWKIQTSGSAVTDGWSNVDNLNYSTSFINLKVS